MYKTVEIVACGFVTNAESGVGTAIRCPSRTGIVERVSSEVDVEDELDSATTVPAKSVANPNASHDGAVERSIRTANTTGAEKPSAGFVTLPTGCADF
ncbi:MAG: hypothetical protein SFX73_30780 [Kofleriaceae bacterium]|nr:hypothetical protein [Kofleriaceae bacterium]